MRVGDAAPADRVRVIETLDGRALAFQEVGDPCGVPVFVLHGTPGCRLSGQHPDASRVAAVGLRLISYDRPGYGRSSRHRGRRIVDCVADLVAIADELEVGRFAVSGGSGGGAHALAVGARQPGRVTRVACEAGGAPYDAPALDWFAGMDPVNVTEFGWALAGELKLARELQREAREVLERLDDDPTVLLDDVELPPSDRALLEDPGLREILRASLREALAQGVWGWVDDTLAHVKPWGFDVAELRVPVEIRYGATDVLAPPAHGAWLAAHVPNATVTIDRQGGHLRSPDERLHTLRGLAGT